MSDQLGEALACGSRCRDRFHSEHDVEVLLAAARNWHALTETGRQFWWCEEHDAPWLEYKSGEPDAEDACFYWYWRVDATDGREKPRLGCRMREMWLVDTLTVTDEPEEGR